MTWSLDPLLCPLFAFLLSACEALFRYPMLLNVSQTEILKELFKEAVPFLSRPMCSLIITFLGNNLSYHCLCCHLTFASDERRKSYIKTLHLSIPSFPIAGVLTPPDVAVQQGKDQETQRRDRKETPLTTQCYFTGPKKVSISRA
jgi:hypothetical protein